MISDYSLHQLSKVTVIWKAVKKSYKLFYRPIVLQAAFVKVSMIKNLIFPHFKETIEFLEDLIIVSTLVLHGIH